MNLTSFRKDIYNVTKSVIENHEELEISVGNEGDGVVLMSLADYRELKTTRNWKSLLAMKVMEWFSCP